MKTCPAGNTRSPTGVLLSRELPATEPAGNRPAEIPAAMSIDQLMNKPVTSFPKKEERLDDADRKRSRDPFETGGHRGRNSHPASCLRARRRRAPASHRAAVAGVGESEILMALGGKITFAREAGKVRFAISLESAEHTGLGSSAQQPKLAIEVHRKP
jgi:hypothetical protein